MSAEHCGHMQDTPYCAYCGRKLWDNTSGLIGLKLHVDKYLITLKRRHEKLLKRNPEHKWVKDTEKAIKKWTSWQEALNKAMMDDAPE